MTTIKSFLVLCITLVLLSGIGSNTIMAAEYNSIMPALAQAIEEAMQQANITGLSVALVDDQDIVWAEGFGYADKANDVKATPETLYRVASISKLLTATAVMQLADQGKLDIDQPLQTYLPEFFVKSRFPDAGPITPRNIMTHHSGLPSNWLNGFATYGADREALVQRSFATLIEKLKDTYVTNPPNTVFSYSNVGYSVLGHAVQHVTGQEFSAYMDAALLKPIGMSASSFTLTPEMKPLLSKEYRNGAEQEHSWYSDIPAARLHTTVMDLSRFMSMMFADGKAGSQRILQPYTVDEMLRPQNSDVPLDFDARWGLGWWLVDIGLDYAGKTAWHSGGDGMWNSLLVTLPEHKLGVVVLNNSGGADAVNYQIATTILEHALEVKTGMTRPQAATPEVVSLSPDELSGYEGVYTTDLGLMNIRVQETQLYADAMGQSFTLLPHGAGRFSIEGVSDAKVTIKTVNDRTAIYFLGHAVGGLGFGERIELTPIPEAWMNRLGTYEIRNEQPGFVPFLSDVQLSFDAQFLILEVTLSESHQRLGFPIEPLSDDEAVIIGLGVNRGDTISVVEVDGEEHLFYSGYVMKKTGSVEEKPAAGTVYEDPQGRFSMPLIGEWTPMETDNVDALFEVPGLDFQMSILTMASNDLETAGATALKQVGIDPATLTQTNTAKLGNWYIIFYSQGEGQGVTILAQVKDDTTYCLIATGDEGLTNNPPDHVMKTIQAFTLAGEEFVLPATVEAFEAYINSFVGDIPPGLSIVIALNGETLYAKGFGLADGPKGMAAEPDTVFAWGSMTKIVTATALMQVVEQGLVNLDAPVSDYLDYFPAEYGITVRHLLTHSAGLGEPPDFIPVNLRIDGQPLPDPDLAARQYVEQFPGLMFEPGSASSYSNPGFVLLGQIVADVSGQPYIEYVQEHILKPLDMQNTDFTYSSAAMIEKAAAGAFPATQVEDLTSQLEHTGSAVSGADLIRDIDGQYAWMNRYNVLAAHGGLVGPVTEVMRFARMHLNGGVLDGVRILSPDSVALMQDMQHATGGPPLGVGLAWFVVNDGEHPYIEHDGGGEGIWAKMRLYPQDGLAIVLMSNASGWERDRVGDAAANVVFSLSAGQPDKAAFTPPITDAEGNLMPDSIAAIETVTLGGVEQSITIRGVDATNPVLLFLHGGPGVPSSPWATWNNFQAELEANFVVVHWDQRGAGKSFSEDLTPEDMHMEHFVSDTLALTDILRERFGQDKIFLWGHSWGSGLGFETLRVNAEPYYAYIASAVRPDWKSTQIMGYEWVLEQARQANDSEAIQALESIQPFDPANREHINMRAHFLSLYRGGDFHTEGLEKAWLDYVLSGQSPEYPAAEVENTMAGLDFTRQTISVEILQSGFDLFRDFPVSPIPVYFFAGRHDHETPGELAEDYYNVLEAPAKHFTWFENSAHDMMYDEPDKTNQELIKIAGEILE